MKYTSVLLGLVLLAACSGKGNNRQIASAAWLAGTWETSFPEGKVFEQWQRVNDSTLAGNTFMVEERDTQLLEQIVLQSRAGTLHYIPTVDGQNGGLPVDFAAIEAGRGVLLFENKEHDFPQRISYRRLSDDSLVAEISGVRNGQNRSEYFPMRRVR